MSAVPTRTVIASGAGWVMRRIDCRAAAGGRPFEEKHRAHVLAIVERGSFTYHGQQRRQMLHPGAILTAHAGACYACGHLHDGGDTCLAVQVDVSLFEEVALHATGTAQFRFSAGALPEARDMLPVAAQLSRRAGEDDVVHFISAVLQRASGHVPATAVSLADNLRVDKVIAHIGRHLDEALPLEALARVAGLSLFHFSRVFKNVAGTTPYRYVLNQRMKLAATQLLDSRKPVSAIAYDCGFGDLSTFNATFKSVYGQSPTRFRLG